MLNRSEPKIETRNSKLASIFEFDLYWLVTCHRGCSPVSGSRSPCLAEVVVR